MDGLFGKEGVRDKEQWNGDSVRSLDGRGKKIRIFISPLETLLQKSKSPQPSCSEGSDVSPLCREICSSLWLGS